MTRAEVLAKLAELPDTADGIAAFLAERGVKGTKSGFHCPIQAWTGARSVSRWQAHMDDDTGLTPAVRLPDAVVTFIRNFDRGRYPELIA